MAAGTKPKKKEEKERDSMSLRLPLHRIDELRAIGEREDRPVSWLIKRGIDLLIESYSSEKPTSTETQQTSATAASAPDPVVAAFAETAVFKEIVTKLKAELPAKLERLTSRQYTLRLRKVKSPVKSVEPAVAVPPTSISKHSVKH